jgi:hypothetical protein
MSTTVTLPSYGFLLMVIRVRLHAEVAKPPTRGVPAIEGRADEGDAAAVTL